jgi:hypothetical protein
MGFFDNLLRSNKIKVHFIDNTTGQTFAISDMSPEQLPETFALDTTLDIQDSTWTVEEAVPQHSVDFRKSKELVLKLRKVEKLDPRNILFTLATISNELPDSADTCLYNDFDLSMREDDWRQNEFLHNARRTSIDEDIRAIKDIWTHQSKNIDETFTAFTNCHVRMSGLPDLKIDFNALLKILSSAAAGSLTIDNHFVADGFSLKTDNTTYYGTLAGDVVTLLGIANWTDGTTQEIQEINHAFDLFLINWPHGETLG